MPASRMGCMGGHYGQYGGVYGAVYGGAVYTGGAAYGGGPPMGPPMTAIVQRPTLVALGPPHRSPAPLLTSKGGHVHGPRMY